VARVRSIDVGVQSVGLAAGCAVGLAVPMLLASSLGLRGVAIAVVLVLALAALIVREDVLVLGFYLSIILVEEFLPELVVDQRWDRSLTVLYGESIGLPAVYLVDVVMGVLIAWLVLKLLIQRRTIPILSDPLTIPLLATATTLGLSCLLSLAIFPDTSTPEGFRYDEMEVGLEASIAPWIPYLQVKTWLYVYMAYTLTRIYLSDTQRIRKFLMVVLIGAVSIVAIGAYRFVFYRVLLGLDGSLFYDDATLFVVILASCFLMLSWGRRLFSPRTVALQGVLVAALGAVLLFSYRRASWIGAAVCLMVTIALMPPVMRKRVGAVAVIGFCILGLYVAFAGATWVQLPSAFTAVDLRASNVYRTAILYNMLQLEEFSLFGYGLRPLWDMPLRMGSFTLNFENVHSLYYWFILRSGIVGLLAMLALFGVALREAWRLRQTARTAWCKVTAETAGLGLILFLLLGWFHPLYGMSRCVVMLGIVLGLLTALRQANLRAPALSVAATTRARVAGSRLVPPPAVPVAAGR
jgi:hypothetical protein